MSLIDKVKDLGTEIKTHWNTPAEGKYVPYKEYKDVVIGVGANYTGAKTLEKIFFGTTCFLIMYHYDLPYLAFSIIGILNMPLGYISALMWWYVCDNLGFLKKKMERVLYGVYVAMMIFGIATIVFDFSQLFSPTNPLITYLNGLADLNAKAYFKTFGTHFLYTGWVGARNIFWRKKLLPKYGRYKYGLYCDVIPKCIMVILIGWLPVYEIPDVSTRFWVANLMFATYNVFGFGNVLEECSKRISPNLQERILVRSYPVKLSHIFNSILAIAIPAIVGVLYDDGWQNIGVFQYVYPITFCVAAGFTMFLAGRIKERIPQPPIEKKVNIKFWDGLFGVLKNKYLLINTIVGLIDSLGNGMLPFVTILYFYTFRWSSFPVIESIVVALVSFAGTPPDLLSPYFLKRFSYKQIMIFYQLSRAIGNAIVALAIWFCGDNLVLCGTICVIVLIFMEMTKTVPTTAGHDMGVRIADYQMYLSGERLESYAGIFGWFTGPITSFVGLIIPIFLLKYGFNSNWDVLYVDESRRNIIVIPLLVDVIGFLLMTIPYFFWDYDNRKQNLVMEVLKRRAEVTEKKAQEEGKSTAGSYKG